MGCFTGLIVTDDARARNFEGISVTWCRHLQKHGCGLARVSAFLPGFMYASAQTFDLPTRKIDA
jgi:hypothetical protein